MLPLTYIAPDIFALADVGSLTSALRKADIGWNL
jgi:hypothetical protein